MPFDEVDAVFEREPPVNSEIVLEMPEKRFEGIGVLRDFRVINELEHIRQCPFEVYVCFPHLVVGVRHLSGVCIDGFLPDELSVFIVPVRKFPKPEQPVIIGADPIDFPDNPPECDTGGSPRMLRKP